MSTQDTAELLSQLKGIHLPVAPVAPDLKPVYLSLALCVIALLVFLFRRYRRTGSWHTEALIALKTIQRGSPPDALPRIATLLRRIALTEDNHPEVRHLHGDNWLGYLDIFFQTDFFSNGDGRIFGDALYRSSPRIAGQMYTDLEKLIKRRKRLR